MQTPSSTRSGAERQGRRANWKENLTKAIEPRTVSELTRAKFESQARELANGGTMRVEGNQTIIPNGTRHYTVYKIQGKFLCACNQDARYGICVHRLAAEMFAAKSETVNLCSVCGKPSPVCDHLACSLAADETESKEQIRARFHAAIDRTAAWFDRERTALHFTSGEVDLHYSTPRTFDYDYTPDWAA